MLLWGGCHGSERAIASDKSFKFPPSGLEAYRLIRLLSSLSTSNLRLLSMAVSNEL
jgi:hypothetical protein